MHVAAVLNSYVQQLEQMELRLCPAYNQATTQQRAFPGRGLNSAQPVYDGRVQITAALAAVPSPLGDI